MPHYLFQLLSHNFFENKSCLELGDGVRSSGKSEWTACEEIDEIWYQLIMDDQSMLKNYRLPLVFIASQSIALHWLSLIINFYWSINKALYIICDSLVFAHQNVVSIHVNDKSSNVFILKVITLRNRSHVALHFFSSRSQMTLKCVKEKWHTAARVSLMFLLCFDIFCGLLLNRCTATWNLLILYNEQKTLCWQIVVVSPGAHLAKNCESQSRTIESQFKKQQVLNWKCLAFM